MKMHLIFTLVFLFLLLTACGGGVPAAATQPPAPAPAATESSPPPTPTLPPPTVTPAPTIPPKPEPARYTFKTEDGRELVGYHYPAWKPDAPVIVLMMMVGMPQSQWEPMTGIIIYLQNWPGSSGGGLFRPAQGIYLPLPEGVTFNVFTFDWSGTGESVPEHNRFTPDLWVLDAKAAYAFAATLPGVDAARIAGIGTSIGADGVVDGCYEGCIGALSLSPGSYFNVPYAGEVKRLDDAGKTVWCTAHEQDLESFPNCKQASGVKFRSFLYAEGETVHGLAFLMEKFAPPDIGKVLLDWLKTVFHLEQ